MLTRIEIDGFKSFERFSLDLQPFTAIVGPNASGKSNLFDAMRLLSALCNTDIHSAMKGLRGEPEEFFRRTADSTPYLEPLLPRLIEDILARDGIRRSDFAATPALKLGLAGRAVDEVAVELRANKEAFGIETRLRVGLADLGCIARCD